MFGSNISNFECISIQRKDEQRMEWQQQQKFKKNEMHCDEMKKKKNCKTTNIIFGHKLLSLVTNSTIFAEYGVFNMWTHVSRFKRTKLKKKTQQYNTTHSLGERKERKKTQQTEKIIIIKMRNEGSCFRIDCRCLHNTKQFYTTHNSYGSLAQVLSNTNSLTQI